MKQLLTILLLFPLFIACSSDDDDKKEEGLTDAQKEAFLVGQWNNFKNAGHFYVYIFGADKSYRKYEVVGGAKIKLADLPGSIGSYWVKGNYIWLENYEGNQSGTLFSIKDENTISFGFEFTRDNTEYTIVN